MQSATVVSATLKVICFSGMLIHRRKDLTPKRNLLYISVFQNSNRSAMVTTEPLTSLISIDSRRFSVIVMPPIAKSNF